VDEHRLDIKQELVARAGFWVAKKRYAMLVINEEGVMLKKPHLDVKGLDVVRSSFPKLFKTFMSDVLISILEGTDKNSVDKMIADIREQMKNVDVLDVMITSSVKDVKKHDTKSRGRFKFNKGTPAHVKSALLYNDVLKHNKITDVPFITNHDKIKYAYLSTNPLRLDIMCLKGYGDPQVVQDIVKNHIDYDKMFESQLQNKLTDFYSAMGWGKPSLDMNDKATDFFSF
jgi:DNA polymerase elongation subunit (family B)